MAIRYQSENGPDETKEQDAKRLLDKVAKSKAISEELDKVAEGTGRKKLVSIRYDEEVLDFFMATGKGWQTRMNEILLEHVRQKAE